MSSSTSKSKSSRPTDGPTVEPADAPATHGSRRPLTLRQRVLLTVAAGLAAALMVAGALYSATGGGAAVDTTTSAPYVGGDLHSLTAVGDRLYIAGHAAAAVSTDGGRGWAPLDTLQGADAMGWAQTSSGLLAGGHPGLYRSTDGGGSFARLTGPDAIPDVHALGAVGATAYLATPQAGLRVSTDGGRTWLPRNPTAGRSFMGTLLVAPDDPQRVVATDMRTGLVESRDGGVSWTSIGGPQGVMAATWNPVNRQQIVVVGTTGSAITRDGGRTWSVLAVPENASTATMSPDGRTLYVAALDGEHAITFASTDDGLTWTRT